MLYLSPPPIFSFFCHLSVCFSDCRISTTCPLPCCQARDKRRCFLLDPFLCLSTQVFMSQSADFSLGAEAHIESPQHSMSLREVLATSSSGDGGGFLSTSKPPSLSREKLYTDLTAHKRVTDHNSDLDQPPPAFTDKMEAAASAEEDRSLGSQ